MSDPTKGGNNLTRVVHSKISKNSKQSPWPDSHDPNRKLAVSKHNFNEVRKRGTSYTWTTTRFLYSKAIYEPDDLTEIDHFILDALLERLHQVRMQSWNSVNRPKLLHVSNCFKLWENTRTGRLRSQALEIFLKQFVPGFLMSSHSYFGWKNQYCSKRWVVRHNQATLKRARPLARIGVGYRDHGTCRNLEIDGAPSWQDVASTQQEAQRESSLDLSDPCLTTFSLFERKLVPRIRT